MPELLLLDSLLLEIDTKIKKLEIQRKTAIELEKKLKLDVKSLEKDNENLDRIFIIFDYYIKNNHEKLSVFENTITHALQDVFNDKYKFEFKVKKNGNNLACDFLLSTDKHDYPLELFTQGNGVKEIISTIMQLLVIKLKNSIPILILDEPYSGLRITRQQPVANFLKQVALEFGIQLLIISHSPEFCEVAENNIAL